MMARSNDVLHAANALVCVLGTATADGLIPGLGTAVGGAASLNHLRQLLGRGLPGLQERLARDLEAALGDPNLRLPTDGRVLIPQMIVAAEPSHADVMAARMDADALVAAMLVRVTDPEHRAAAMQDAFRRVVAPILRAMLADPELSAVLQPAFTRAVAQSLGAIGEGVGRTEGKVDALAEQVAALTALLEASGKKKEARAEGITDKALIELARRISVAVDDPQAAFRELENVVDIAIRVQAEGAVRSNHGDFVDTVLARVAELSRDGRHDAAAADIDAALAQEAVESTARRLRLLSSAIEQDLLRRDPAAVARRLIARADVEAGGRAAFEALRAVQDEWQVRGRDLGLALDQEVGIALARLILSRATSPDERGTALNDLGISLWERGERESGTARLEEAVAAYRAALEELARERVPLQWARAQMNLGTALATLGQRESGTARLEEAVAAYRAALEERTRERVPLQWAGAQMNLGSALLSLGQRESGTARLEEAVAAFRAALEDLTRERMPLHWAMTQMNLGAALATLGQRQSGTARLEEAVAAFRAALEERTRERVPLQWATAQMNLGTAMATLGQRESGTTRLEEAVAAYRAALEEWTRERVPLDWADATASQGEAMSVLAKRTTDRAMAAEGLALLQAGEQVLRDGGFGPKANYYAAQIPEAQARLTALGG